MLLLSSVSVFAAQASNSDAAIRAFLRKHPEAIAEALEKHKANQYKKKLQQSTVDVDAGLVLKNPTGKYTLVSYVDYRCSACHRGNPELMSFLNKHPEVKWVAKPMPVLGEDSVILALMMYDAQRVGKGYALHQAIFSGEYTLDETGVNKMAKKVGIRPITTDNIAKHRSLRSLQKNYEESVGLENQSVPFYILSANGVAKDIRGAYTASGLEKILYGLTK